MIKVFSHEFSEQGIAPYLRFESRDYFSFLQLVAKYGTLQPSRLGYTRELISPNFVFSAYEVPYRPNLNVKLGYLELLQVLSGYFDERHFNAIANLSFEYGLVHAYGLKLAQQLEKVLQQLRDYTLTRRAVVYIGKPDEVGEQEKPCIQSYQFIARDEYLHLHSFVRSWDLFYGLPYDVMVMGGLVQVFATCLGLKIGDVFVSPTSAHLYMNRFEGIEYKDGIDVNLSLPNNLLGLDSFRQIRESAIDEIYNLVQWRKKLEL